MYIPVQVPSEPIITKVAEGEYSTIYYNNTVETIFFGNDGGQRFVKRSALSPQAIHDQHVNADYQSVKMGL